MIIASAVNGPRLTRSYRAAAAEEKRKADEEGTVADPADFPIDRARLEHLRACSSPSFCRVTND